MAPPPLIAPSLLVMPLSGLSSGWLSRCLSSRRRLPSAGASHYSITSVRLVVTSPRFSRHHLPSAGASASHRAIASRHAPLGPLVWWLVRA
jgi:hypothetical protein